MLYRVLEAVAGASPRVVVGPARPDLPPDVLQVRERPPGGGPVAALAAGLAALNASAGPLDGVDAGPLDGLGAGLVAVLAADLPFLTSADIDVLCGVAATGDHDGAVPVDADGRQQWLCGVWRTDALVGRLAELGPPAGQSMRTVVSGLRPRGVDLRGFAVPPPWYDCDTEDDYRRAKEWGGHESAR
jgi:molybdopterin-guanine dinucleotide biosynthesis protein A